MKMNEEQLNSMSRDLSATPHVRIFEVVIQERSVGSSFFILRWPGNFWSGIRDGQNQWQVVPGYWSLQPQIVERQ